MSSQAFLSHEVIGTKTFPRARLCSGVTPLEPLVNLPKARNLGPVWVKRDDLTGLGLGGNKARQLEFYFGQALAEGADTVLITGAVQSNFVRMTAAAACKLGMECHIQLEERVSGMGDTYRHNGNVLLDRVFGATLHSYPSGEDEAGADANLEVLADRLRQEGKKPFVIHLAAGHPPMGALGYVICMREALDQMAAMDISPHTVVVASGSGQTHSGVLAGLRLAGSPLPVLGACVRREASQQAPRILDIATRLAAMVGKDGLISEADVSVTDAFLGPGYGKNDDRTWDGFLTAARSEGLVMDPVYSGKSFAAALSLAADGEVKEKGGVLYIHTGGTPALFGYAPEISEMLDRMDVT